LDNHNSFQINEAYFRKDFHLHVIAGDDCEFWVGSVKRNGPFMNVVFDDYEEAHSFFIDYIRSFMPDVLDDDEIEDSFHEFVDIVSDEEPLPALVIREVISFEDLDVKLCVCSGCVPYYSN
jgi:hypothetical protein